MVIIRFKKTFFSGTVSEKEMARFEEHANEWWRPGGPYDALRSMNRLRVPLVKKLCGQQDVSTSKPLKGFKILDVGCGGGILAEVCS